MTDGFDQAMRTAGIALLQGNTNLTIYDGPVPAGATLPYVRVYSTVEWLSDDPDNALDGLTGRATVRWYCHCVGGNDQAAVIVAEQVRATLLDQRPAVAGMQPGLIRFEQDGGTQPTVDEITGTPIVDAVHVYRLTCDT